MTQIGGGWRAFSRLMESYRNAGFIGASVENDRRRDIATSYARVRLVDMWTTMEYWQLWAWRDESPSRIWRASPRRKT